MTGQWTPPTDPESDPTIHREWGFPEPWWTRLVAWWRSRRIAK